VAWRRAYGTKALTDFITDRLGTALGGSEGRKEDSEGVVGELHVCGVLLRVRLIGLFVCLL
jgi:hypothetical protein